MKSQLLSKTIYCKHDIINEQILTFMKWKVFLYANLVTAKSAGNLRIIRLFFFLFTCCVL